ncbi:MAG: aspartate dehydrogenase [Chloroflexota bacterium]
MADLRVGLIGHGAVGRRVAELVADGAAGSARIVGVLVRDPQGGDSHRARQPAPFVGTAADLIALRPDVVVEAAGHDALRTYVPPILEAGIEVLAISVGALADDATLQEISAAAERGGTRLRVPSGAIAALDGISAAAVGRVERVVHTVRKPPATLLPPAEAEAVMASGRERELFAGPAREAAQRFPANVNVVAAVSLAGIGVDRTEARVVADPGVTRNTHEVEVEGAFGRLTVRIENVPSDNPKTGLIVAQSIVRTLRAYGEKIVVGS